MARVALQTGARAGAVTLLSGYAEAASIRLQVYRARPAQLKPPSAFVEEIPEDADAFTNDESQRTVRVRLRIVWGVFDSGDSVDQRDKFVDGFYAHVMDNPHAFGANTTCGWVSVADDPDFSASWITGDERTYYATTIVLEGFAST